jgi:hypothetical protein
MSMCTPWNTKRLALPRTARMPLLRTMSTPFSRSSLEIQRFSRSGSRSPSSSIPTEVTLVSCRCSVCSRNVGSIEGADPEDAVEADLSARRAHDLGDRVDGAQPRLDPVEQLPTHEVDLVHDDTVGERHLLDRLVLDAVGLDLVEVVEDVLGVDQGDDGVEPQLRGHLVVDEEGLRHRGGIGKAGGASSIPISPNSFSITAMRLPCWPVRMWFSSVVLPDPRKPARTVTGTLPSRSVRLSTTAMLAPFVAGP